MGDKNTRYELDARGDPLTFNDGIRSEDTGEQRSSVPAEDPDTTRAPRPSEIASQPSGAGMAPAAAFVAPEANASELTPEPSGSWRGMIADALAEPERDNKPEAPTPSSEATRPAEPSSDVDHAASFTEAAEGLFRPPTTGPGDETHLITIGRRLDPTLRIPRPVAPVIEPRPEAAAETKPKLGLGQADKEIWKSRLYTAARYAGIALAAYLALVLVLIVVFRFVNPPGSMLMLRQLLTGTSIDRTWASFDNISPSLVRAVIVSEDGRFCEHSGIDTQAMKEAIDRASGGAPRGASTISMQVTKNLFLWNAKSYIRKVIEIPLTLIMELVWPKKRVLEVYLNIAEWGPGVFGAEAAARHHFSKSAANLSDREAALLAAVLPNPIARDAGNAGSQTSRKARVIQSRMKAYGAVASCVVGAASTQPAAAAAKRSSLRKSQPLRNQLRKKPVDDWSLTPSFGN